MSTGTYITVLVIMSVCFIWRYLKLRKELEDKYLFEINELKKIIEQNKSKVEEFDTQKYELGEANIGLLEQTERNERQKLEMAEANIKLLELKEQVELEKERSEKLLLNILPEKVAEELKLNGKTVPEMFENVSVFFSDIVDFTHISSTIEPQRLIEELSDIFTAFDRIAARNNCQRIKTIGDAYMCVSGMPVPDPRHAENILNTALDIVAYINERKSPLGFDWKLRVGIHSGKVVGGVVGIDKYIYDVFGDTINTAARMEQHSEVMKINVSEDTYKLAKDKFNFVERKDMEVKGKGPQKTYFLAGRK